MEPLFAGAELVAVPWQPLALTRVARSSQLLVNTTSIGMGGAGASGESPLPGEALRADLAVYDIIYTPAETELVRQARRLGAPASNGLDMLVYQGAEAFTLWTGVAAPTEVMRSAARAALAGREGQ